MTEQTIAAASAAAARQSFRFRSPKVGRYLLWSFFALALIALPMVFTSSLAITMLSQMGYAIVICL
ncbi:MAG: branched-chain amino acid ABC transporter permease, partial [Giesbergeria sp.]